MWYLAYVFLFLLAVGVVWSAIKIFRERVREWNEPRPTYYVRHPDGSFTEAP